MASYTYANVGGEFLVNTKTEGNQQLPRVAALASGGFVMVWNDTITTNGTVTNIDVKAQRYDAEGNKIGGEILVNTVTAGLQGQATVTALASGGFVVGWTDNSGGTNDVRAQIFGSEGAKSGEPFLLNTTTAGSQLQPSIAALDGGGFVATWRTSTTDSVDSADLRGQIFNAAGAKVGGEFEVAAALPVQQSDAIVTTLESGRFVVTWTEATGPASNFVYPANVRAQIFEANGTKVGDAFTVNPVVTDTQARPVVAALAAGGFAIAWQDISGQGGDASEYGIRAQLYSATGAAVGSSFLVNTSTANTQELPRVTSLASGGFIVSWSDETGDGSGAGIKAQIFDAAGAKVGAEFIVNTTTLNSQLFSTLIELASGRVVIGWDDPSGQGGDASEFGIKAQLIALYTAATIAGTANADVLNGTAGNDAIEGLGGNDILNGGVRDDLLIGGAGNDVLDGGSEIDRMEGGAGDDSYYVDNIRDTAVELAGAGTDTVFSRINYTLQAGTAVEILSAESHAAITPLNLTGNELAQAIYGNAGVNSLDGGAGADTLIGFGGDDTYSVDQVGDMVVEGAGGGNDLIYSRGNYRLGAGVHVEVLSSDFHAGTATLELYGNELANLLYGNQGRNYLEGGGGADTLIGFGGDDFYGVDQRGDRVVEGLNGGVDTLYTAGTYVLEEGQHIEVFSADFHAGFATLELYGNGFDNVIYGNFGRNYLVGGGGVDTLIGWSGDDDYLLDNAADVIVENMGEGFDRAFSSASYTLAADDHVELLSTAVHALTTAIDLTGNGFANQLYGNAGANILDGKGGNDLLVGFGGADRFQFTTAPNAATNLDRIESFETGLDRIALDDAAFAGLAPGALAAGAFRLGATAQDGDDRILYDQATGALLFDADGNGAAAAIQFATLLNRPADLSAADFVVI